MERGFEMGSSLSVLDLVELNQSKEISPISLESLALAKSLSESSGGKLSCLMMGKDLQDAADELRHYGIDSIHVVDHPLLETYQPDYYLAAFERVFSNTKPDLILMGNSLTLLDLAPRIACRLGLGLIADCVDIRTEGDEVLFSKPIFSGNVMATYSCASPSCLATLRKGSMEAAAREDEPAGVIVSHDIEIDASIPRTEVIESGVEEEAGISVDKATVVVSGGRGLGGPEGFELLQELADIMGAAVGASRPPCDLGWVAANAQVGQTGAIIAPALYFAIGISGSMQHISGMARSKTIVAINKDPKAIIFSSADYGVVGDFEEVIPAFRDSLKKIMA
jgi:electron transfer flavoprotein alpha subunit